MKKLMRYIQIRDSTKIENIIDLVYSDEIEKSKLIITRIDKHGLKFYFPIDDKIIIHFDIYYPSKHLIKELETIKNETEYIK